MVYSIATPEVKAVLTIIGAGDDGANKVETIGKGDTLKGLVVAPTGWRRKDITIEEATVVGFRLGAINIDRGVTRVYDGIPTYLQDPDGKGNLGLVEETMCVKTILLEIADPNAAVKAAELSDQVPGTEAETKEDDKATKIVTVAIERIKDLESVEAASDENSHTSSGGDG